MQGASTTWSGSHDRAAGMMELTFAGGRNSTGPPSASPINDPTSIPRVRDSAASSAADNTDVPNTVAARDDVVLRKPLRSKFMIASSCGAFLVGQDLETVRLRKQW